MNIELQLLATMLQRGNFEPLIRGDITPDHFVTEEGKILYNFITTWRGKTDGVSQFPSLSIVRSRFANAAMEIPEPDPGDTVEALAYETSLQKLKGELRAAATELENIANSSSDIITEAVPVIGRLRTATESVRKGQHISLGSGILGIVDDYTKGEILPQGIAWPWPSMTKASRGLHRKEFVVIAGRPKSRKTFTAIAIAMNALKCGARVLFFTPEMPVRQILLRCIACIADLPYTEFKDGTLDPAEECRLFEAARDYGLLEGEDEESYSFRMLEVLGMAPSLDIIQSTGKDLAWMEAQIAMYRPDVVIFDSFYRQHADGVRKGSSDWSVVTSLSRGLKDMIMNTNIIGIGTHQLNRAAQKEVGDISNLSLADAVGQDADLIGRVITGKVDGIERSAFVILGGREVPFDGILFNNIPCSDFTELGAITNLKVVERLMQAEDLAQEEDDPEGGDGLDDEIGKKGKEAAQRAKNKPTSRKAFGHKAAKAAAAMLPKSAAGDLAEAS